MDYQFLMKTRMFGDMEEDEIKEVLRCLGASVQDYEKGETIFHVGEEIDKMGLVLCGSVNVENDDFWGNRSLISHVEPGYIFGETYACLEGEALMVNVIAAEKSRIMFLNVGRVIRTCKNSCVHHNKLIKNLLEISAQKNIALSRRILHTSAKSIRGRLLSYFSQQVKQSGSQTFTIPFNRQQLADYLNVDRSAMSNELSKMRNEGILTFEKNKFHLHE